MRIAVLAATLLAAASVCTTVSTTVSAQPYPSKPLRFIVGYALSNSGMLFRGELVTDASDNEARRAAVFIANMCVAFDDEDAA